jgi:hypothetical protein
MVIKKSKMSYLVIFAALLMSSAVQADLDLTTATWDMSSIGWGLGGNLALDDDLTTRSTCVGHALPPDPTATSTNEWIWVDLGADLQLNTVEVDFQLSAAIDYTIRLLTEAEATTLGLAVDQTAAGGVDNWTIIATAVGLPDCQPAEGEEDLSDNRELAGNADVWDFSTGVVTIPDSEVMDPNGIAAIDVIEPVGRYLLIDSTYVSDDFWGNVSIWEINVDAGPQTAPEAKNPQPKNGATSVGLLTDLSWLPGVNITAQDVYFSANFNDVNDLTITPIATGDDTLDTVSNATLGGPLDYFTSYYWRVVSTDANSLQLHPGAVWNFTTEPGVVTNISPGDGETDVAPSDSPVLVWDGFDGVSSYNVWLGTTSGSLSLVDNVAIETATLSGTSVHTEYFWQIEALDAGNNVISTGPEWSFTTGGPHYWPLDQLDSDPNVALDMDGNNNGTLISGIVWVDDAERGKCLELDGTTGMSCNTISIRNSSFTMSVWAKRADLTNDYKAFMASGEMGLMLTPTEGQLLFNSAGGVNVILNNVTNDTIWHHWSGVYDDSTGQARIFKDGEKIYDGPAGPFSNTLGDDEFRIGGRWNGFAFNGRIDEVRLYDFALTDTQVADIYLNSSDATWICQTPPFYDINDDCLTDLVELADLAAKWLDCGRYPATECGL